jgi:hypothetical protein
VSLRNVLDDSIPNQAGRVHGQALCTKSLGNVVRARCDYDGARAACKQTLALYQQAAELRGQAECIKGLGDVALDRSDHDDARWLVGELLVRPHPVLRVRPETSMG